VGEEKLVECVCTDRMLRALKKNVGGRGRQVNVVLFRAEEKMLRGKKLSSREFHLVYAAIFKPGPCVKYGSPERWERVSREREAQVLLGHI